MPIRFFKAPWRKLVGVGLLLPSGWQFCRWLLEGAGYVDFFNTHIKEPGWVGAVIEWLVNPPPWTFLPTIILGFALILWDERRRARLSAEAQSAGPPSIAVLDPSNTPMPQETVAFQSTSATTASTTEEFTHRSLEYFCAIQKSQNAIQARKLLNPYLGMFIKFSGSLANIIEEVNIITVGVNSSTGCLLICRFAVEHRDFLSRLDAGDEVVGFGAISDENFGTNVILNRCRPNS